VADPAQTTLGAAAPPATESLEKLRAAAAECGSVAAQALLGRQFRVTRERGRFVVSPLARRVTATVHPSSILRAGDEEARRTAMAEFVDDLRVVADELKA
jgi:DNA polymerase